MAAQRLIPRVREVIRRKHYSVHTEKSYVKWIVRYVRFHGLQHPKNLSERHIEAFLTHLAKDGNVAASTQNQALNALVFLYREVLELEMEDFSQYLRAKTPEVVPNVLSESEVRSLLSELEGLPLMMVSILYGSGLRLSELLHLRVKDIDFDRRQILVRQGKGMKDRVTPLPVTIIPQLKVQIAYVKELHTKDILQGYGTVYLPGALEKKYPYAGKDFRWQWLFPSYKLSVDPRSDRTQRHHVHQDWLMRQVREAARRARLSKRITMHSFRHSFATHLLENNKDIRTVQELLGHNDVRTTMRYTHVAKIGASGTRSPLDLLQSKASSDAPVTQLEQAPSKGRKVHSLESLLLELRDLIEGKEPEPQEPEPGDLEEEPLIH